MKNTPKVRRLFEQMSDIAEHLTSGYRIETMSYSDGDTFTEEDLQDGLAQLITGDWTYGSEICWENMRVETYEQAGVMTYNKGLVLILPDGTEFQLTIVQSR